MEVPSGPIKELKAAGLDCGSTQNGAKPIIQSPT